MRRGGSRVRGALVLALLVVASCSPAVPGKDLPRVDLPFEHYELDNGLRVILHPDNRIPVVSVNVWYGAGPANEQDGQRGLAHLLEHMMLQGSGHAPGDYISRLQAVGATGVNANTDLDRTSYVQDVPADYLELALWAESDRMGYLLEAVDPFTLRAQQGVIRNERRQVIDNAPYGLGQEEVYRRLFPPSHPYHHYIFGSHQDMQAIELEDVEEFFRSYYAPNNASLAIAGNFDVAGTKALVERYFGTLERGPEVQEPEIEVPTLEGESRAVVTDSVELPRVYLAWITPEAFSDGDAQAGLAARMLGGGDASRLYRDLVHQLQIAQSVTAGQRSLAHGSVFQISATAKPGHSAEELEAAIGRVVDRMASDGPGEAELAASKASHLSIALRSLEPAGAVADRLNSYQRYVGDPDYLQQDLLRYDRVTRDQVRTFVRDHLARERRVVVHVNPGPKTLPDDPDPPEPAEPAARRWTESPEPWRFEVPAPSEAPPTELPVPRSMRLDNGLTVYLVERPELPLVTAHLIVLGGSTQDPVHLPGLSGFTSALLDRGAGSREAIAIANDMAALGSTLQTGSSREAGWVITQALKQNLEPTLRIMADVAMRPSFPESEVERVRSDRLATLRQQRDQPLTTAFKVMWREHYGAEHPYGHLAVGTEQALTSITREDLIAFYRQAFAPGRAALILTGDLDREEARELASEFFGEWDAPGGSGMRSTPVDRSAHRVLLVDRPGAPQAAVVVAQPGLARDDPDYEHLSLVNSVLGSLFSSRLNQSLRQKLGATYGVNSQLTQSREPGLLYVSMSVENRHVEAAIREVTAELGRLSESGITEGELDEARRAIVGSLPNLYRTNPSTASNVAHLYALGLGQDYFRGLESRLQAITPDDVLRAAQRHLDPDGAKVVAVGDRTLIGEQLVRLDRGLVSARSPAGEPEG